MKKSGLAVFMLLAAGILSGCAKQQQIPSEPKCLSGVNIDSAMRGSEKVLVGMNFVINKADPKLSIITTKPLIGGQFFELWRKDNVGGYNRAMSSLHTIQRIVELGFNENQGQVCIVCKVTLERLSIPEKRIDSAASTYSMFSSSEESEQSLAINPEQEAQMEWLDIGRDPRLETVILDKIDKKLTSKKGGR
ncbi:MAG: hypothetical protein KJ757_00625 [Planctomycetes bacterium]|nr:hypothetical protein [Planctomycetota bacterium]MBU1517481.1 hypothetical protein [Planctomycetota bacterium]MBU2458589.1 hypothetical protein [Planctomycetota bacterium]MBU2596059.1 hypothetical protein [Planctomycetota bacterium]